MITNIRLAGFMPVSILVSMTCVSLYVCMSVCLCVTWQNDQAGEPQTYALTLLGLTLVQCCCGVTNKYSWHSSGIAYCKSCLGCEKLDVIF